MFKQDRRAVLFTMANKVRSSVRQARKAALYKASGASVSLTELDAIFSALGKNVDLAIDMVRNLKDEPIVFIRRTVPTTLKVYHWVGCGYIGADFEATSLSDAVSRGLTACKNCRSNN
jgi:hypothetical protein